MKKLKKGDTLIEVMFAVSVFAAIMIGGLALMNSGLARTQGTLQLSMARNAIDSQAEALRYLNAVHVANHPGNTGLSTVWNQITSGAVPAASNLQACNIPDHAFVVDTLNVARIPRNRINVASTYPRLIYSNSDGDNADTNNINIDRTNFNSSEGLWVEAVQGEGNEFFDFHIRACWNSPGSNAPMTLGTIVRLYAPN